MLILILINRVNFNLLIPDNIDFISIKDRPYAFIYNGFIGITKSHPFFKRKY